MQETQRAILRCIIRIINCQQLFMYLKKIVLERKTLHILY